MVKTVLLITNTSWKKVFQKKRFGLEGLYVIATSDLQEAISLLSEIKLDLIIIDITMQIPSFELCRKILVIWSVPILFYHELQVFDLWDSGVERVIGSKLIN